MSMLVHHIDRRSVDRFGMVACPRAGEEVPLEACLECRELHGALHDDDGAIRAIRCRFSG